MTVPCPCCGAEMPVPGLSALRHMRLPPNERRVLDALIDVYPHYMPISRIVDRVYSDDPTGGPDTAVNAVAVYLSRLRRKLSTYGWTAGRGGAHSVGVGLRQLEERDAA